MRGQTGMEPEVRAPRLVDDQGKVRGMGAAGDPLDVAQRADVAGLDQKDTADLRSGADRRRDVSQ